MPGVARIGDMDSDGDTLISGSTTVFANGIGVVRIGDMDSDGDTVISGSTDVIAGG